MQSPPAQTDIEKLARILGQRAGNGATWQAYLDKATTILNEVAALSAKLGEIERHPEGILAETDDYIDLSVGGADWRTSDDCMIREDDYRVDGEVWRVHKGDADPHPSRPHAHCIAGAKRFVGCKLHLGTRQLYHGREALGRYLASKQFDRLVVLIRPKFPGLVLPLPTVEAVSTKCDGFGNARECIDTIHNPRRVCRARGSSLCSARSAPSPRPPR